MSNTLLNTKTSLYTAVAALPDHCKIHMWLGLDGDCDFTRCVTDYVSYYSSKQDLLGLIEEQPDGDLPTMHNKPHYLVLSKRHAVYLPDVCVAA